MADRDSGLGHQRLQFGGDLPDALDAVVHEIDLAAAVQFLLEGGLDQFLVPTGDHGLDRHAVFGGSFDHGHLAQAYQRHVQSAGNGRGRHGEHVDLLAHLLDALFVAHSEALFFVYDEQSEVGELYVFGEQAVGADQDIDFASLHFLQNFFLLLGRAETTDHFNGDREGRETLLERLVVLECEYGGGCEYRDLFIVADGFECGAHGDFGFAVAHIAAQQAVHGL